MKIKNKKAQEEIIGFVLIVVIVVIIFLILLGIIVRQKPQVIQKESADVYQYLESMMEYTSDCAISYEPAFSRVGVLIDDCHLDSKCLNQKSACETLNLTLRETIEANWNIGQERAVKGYIFNATYSSNSGAKEVIFIFEGNCSSSMIGAEYLYPAYPGTIRSALEICY